MARQAKKSQTSGPINQHKAMAMGRPIPQGKVSPPPKGKKQK